MLDPLLSVTTLFKVALSIAGVIFAVTLSVTFLPAMFFTGILLLATGIKLHITLAFAGKMLVTEILPKFGITGDVFIFPVSIFMLFIWFVSLFEGVCTLFSISISYLS